jgi:asparagine synthase (glutamine-hydrolysing)
VFLSGGLDSSLVTAFAVEQHPRIATFSMGFQDPSRDESAEAAAVAQACGTDHHHFVFREEDFHSLLSEVVGALDEPLGDQATLPLFWLCREARKSVTVVLSGEGADEAFGGYGYYLDDGAPPWSGGRRGRLLGGRGNTTPSGFPLLTSEGERRRLVPGLRRDDDMWEHAAMARVATGASDLQRRGLADATTWLPDDLLVKFDRMAMAHSLEGRAPYLQPDLFEYGLRLPDEWRADRRGSKLALREVARARLPSQIVDGRKRGFVLPMRQWLASWFERAGPLGPYVAERCPEGLDAEALAGIVREDLERGVRRERLLFAVVVLLEWSRRNTIAPAGT